MQLHVLPLQMPIPPNLPIRMHPVKHIAWQSSPLHEPPPPEHIPAEHVCPDGQSAFVQHCAEHTQLDPLFM
jgi:hypothetical protein